MKRSLIAIAVLGLTGVVGCSSGKSNNYGVTGTDVTDLSTPPTASSAYTPAPVAQPVVYDTMTTATPASSSMMSSSGGGSGNYTIKKGDTLFGIARQRYGDGKQWQKIASANPGLKPANLRVGQSIVIP